jgi:hypothetical protein
MGGIKTHGPQTTPCSADDSAPAKTTTKKAEEEYKDGK